MRRQESSATLADGVKVHRVKLIDNPVVPGQNKYVRGQEFLREMAEQYLLKCGPFGFDRLLLYKEGESWVIAMDSTDTQREG